MTVIARLLAPAGDIELGRFLRAGDTTGASLGTVGPLGGDLTVLFLLCDRALDDEAGAHRLVERITRVTASSDGVVYVVE